MLNFSYRNDSMNRSMDIDTKEHDGYISAAASHSDEENNNTADVFSDIDDEEPPCKRLAISEMNVPRSEKIDKLLYNTE